MYISKKDREIIRNKFQGKCAYSGTELKDDWQVDHKISKAEFHNIIFKGCPIDYSEINDINNLVPCQRIINHYKRALPLDTFRTWFLGGLHERLKKLPRNTKVEKSRKRKAYLLEVASLFDITEEKPFNGKFYFEMLNN
jgi:5-methylcytosine-specific restriction endonuclease McrA